ncbi:MAG: hypothetical protein CO188_00555 [Zetaproteobacteria bacterium CG_4_9_14_3_um_filter_54_145]|nr:MAG: hypothetical protein CO188_00555 [Zetaproteobacteria bacterium CG_4_9_14_3_um_filter_54_145]
MICFARAYMHLFAPDDSLLPRIRVKSISPQRTRRTQRQSKTMKGNAGNTASHSIGFIRDIPETPFIYVVFLCGACFGLSRAEERRHLLLCGKVNGDRRKCLWCAAREGALRHAGL